uniref:Putative YceI like family protein n=1 Tax=uncultured marine microorganism HF4000_APKG2M17 TaxID=455548 RepID=B3T6S7_9ZZZZ|nr:putative YceI like family protein [uncultured marine microorganism HF4000_APKG2M17]
MKRFAVTLLLISITLPALGQDQGEERRPIRIDRNHSTLGFRIPVVHGLSTVTGKFTDFSVELFWDADDLENSSVNLKIQVESVATGIENRDNDIKRRILDAETYPTITFESSSIEGGPFSYDVTGTFIMHGVSREITLNLDVRSFDDAEEDFAWTAYRVSYTIDRADYGVDWKHGIVNYFVGDDIVTDIVLLTR